MTMSNATMPGARAREDWNQQRSRYQVSGTLATDRPLLRKGQPFYPASSGCAPTVERLAYCREYNETLDALVAQHGVPNWAPGRRLPNRDQALALLEQRGTATSPPPGISADAHRACEWIQKARDRRGVTTTLWAFVPEREVVLLGGNVSPRAGLIDVIDARGGAYMASYEYRRRHVPKMPWDESP